MRVLNYEFENHNGLQLIISSQPAIEYTQLNHFELNMLKQNALDYFLCCEVEVIDNEYKFHYPIHGYKKLQHVMQVHCKSQLELYQFISKLVDAIQASYSNMLTPDGCIIQLDALFYDEQAQKVLLAYLPVQQKEKIVYSFLQWFLYWSNHVDIKDHKHLHKLFSMFIAHDFSLERMQQYILDYIYNEHANVAVYTSTNQQSFDKTDDNLSKHDIQFDFSKQKDKQMGVYNDREGTELNRLENSKFSGDQSLSQSPQLAQLNADQLDEEEGLLIDSNEENRGDTKLRAILVSCLLCCLPLAVWIKLYVKQPSFANLMLCIGITIITIACLLFIAFKHKLKKRPDASLLLFENEDTEEKYSPYRYYEEDKQKIANRLEQLRTVAEDNDSNPSKLPKQHAEQSMQRARQLETVQLEADDYTVHLEQRGKQSVILCRKHQNQEQHYSLSQLEIIVGRSFEGVHVNDEFSGVSRLHIQFEFKNGLVIAKDLGSRNGSYLNDMQMTPYKNYKLNEQDRIQLVGKDGPIYYIKWT